MRLDPAKDQSTPKHFDNYSKYVIQVQFKARSEERIAISSNTVTRNCSLQHTARRSH